MRSNFEKLLGTERAATRLNRQLPKNTPNGTQRVSESFHKQEKELSTQTVQERERLVRLGTSAAILAHEVGNPLQESLVA